LDWRAAHLPAQDMKMKWLPSTKAASISWADEVVEQLD
jgi:hypothetical protein